MTSFTNLLLLFASSFFYFWLKIEMYKNVYCFRWWSPIGSTGSQSADNGKLGMPRNVPDSGSLETHPGQLLVCRFRQRPKRLVRGNDLTFVCLHNEIWICAYPLQSSRDYNGSLLPVPLLLALVWANTSAPQVCTGIWVSGKFRPRDS